MWTIKHHKQFEKLICSKCPADINRDYAPCAKCKRSYDFETGYKACKKKSRKRLTKAIELLTRFVMASAHFNGKEADLVKEAEQFIKETDK